MNKYAAESKAAQEGTRRWRQCERKKAFKTEEQARRPGQRHYLCPWCGNWHRTASLMRMLKIRT